MGDDMHRGNASAARRCALAGRWALAAAMMAGCSSHGTANQSPKSSPAPAVARTARPSPAALTARQAVLAAYSASWTASDQAERAGNAAAARRILAPYLTGSYLQAVVAKMPPYWAAHQAARGHMIAHVTSVYIHGRAGVVVDCQDASGHMLVNTVTGKPVPGTQGPARARLYASLMLAQDRWRVASITYTGPPACTP